MTLTTGSGFFVQEAARNNQTLAGDLGDDYQALYHYSVDAYRGLSQYQLTTAAGDYLAPIKQAIPTTGCNPFGRGVRGLGLEPRTNRLKAECSTN